MNAPCGLAIEASTDLLGLAACRGGRREYWSARPARDETQSIYIHAARLLARLDAGLDGLDFVAFGCGPGSFTGVRVAAAVAQSIAYARAIPVCRSSSLAVLAAGAARELGAGLIATCLDARMGKVYVALYRAGAGGVTAVVPDQCVDPLAFTMPGSDDFVAVGAGWQAYAGLLARHGDRVLATAPELLPSADDLLDRALADFQAGRGVPPELALPEYLGQRPAMPARPVNECPRAGDADAE